MTEYLSIDELMKSHAFQEQRLNKQVLATLCYLPKDI